ncbi:hypothetical protein MPSEU_000367300 [Mayamaea pseudoterrestris]|nr:hypothetical protein MPSEU_000367300 [Mayamaea pseudoterrestris]
MNQPAVYQPHPSHQQQQNTPPPPHAIARRSGPAPPPRVPKQKKKQIDDDIIVTQSPDQETEDGRIVNRQAVKAIIDTWIYKQVRQRQAEFTQYKQASLFLGTWNVNAKGKSDERLDEWLCADWQTATPDIVAVGFQEIVDLNAVNVAVDNKTQQRSQFWVEQLTQTLNRRAGSSQPYVLVASKSMVGLLIVIFVKAVHQHRVQYVSAASVGVGVMGMMGNKGGVSIRLHFYDTTLCFVCSHLAAHRENVTGRNQDFSNVYSKMVFDVGERAIQEFIRSGSLSHWSIGKTEVGIADHDMIFFIGDLNYRIDESMMTEKVLQLSEKNILDELRTLDQLNVERAAGRAFSDFFEGILNFPPTYKYQPGTETYDQRPDKKVRAPAWCDRILWSAQQPEHVQQITYGRSEKPNISDHKAVYSTMRVTIKDVIQSKREAIYEQLMKLVDTVENRTLPVIKLDRVKLDFGLVHYEQSASLSINITNFGGVVAHWRLIPKLDENVVSKPWITVAPAHGLIIPGSSPSCIVCTVTITKDTAHMLNSGREVLSDVLVLRLENGRDYYITVEATYARSCFGMSAEELVVYSDPVRNVPLDSIKRSKGIDPRAPATLCIPKELWRIIDAIYENGLYTPHLFTEVGILEEIAQIRECLDTGTRFGEFCIHSYAETLTTFLESLSAPIVPGNLFPSQEIDSLSIQSCARRLLEELPPVHYNIFVYVISFFREVLIHRDNNLLSAAKIARVCCSAMAAGADIVGFGTSAARRHGMQLIILHLLETSSI